MIYKKIYIQETIKLYLEKNFFVYIYIYEDGLKRSWHDIIFVVDDIFLPIGSKHWNTDRKSV